MDHAPDRTRRAFISAALGVGAGSLIAGCATSGAPSAHPDEAKKPEEEVSPAEDLMREHGVLKRVLLIYAEALRRLDANEDLPPDTVADAAGIIRTFIEDYHEKLEENYLFPRFRDAHTLVDLVDVLVAQHQAGRDVTDVTIHLTTPQALRDHEDRARLAESMRLFIRMYNPHEAREDTVLFPALRTIVTPNEYDALGEDFEDKEHELFGADGFEAMVDRVATIEKKLGIYDLAQFTPHM